MNKYLLLIFMMTGLCSCTMKDEQYYRNHPKELQKIIEQCNKQQSVSERCEQMKSLAIRMNGLAYQLQLSPQSFGNKILLLQQTIATQVEQLKKEGPHIDIKKHLEQNQRQLVDLLAVVKWLESPEG